jgi:hypothetical protein
MEGLDAMYQDTDCTNLVLVSLLDILGSRHAGV